VSEPTRSPEPPSGPTPTDDDIEPIDLAPARAERRAPSNKFDEVIRLIREAQPPVPLVTNPRDGKAVKESTAAPADIAAAYIARARGEWMPYPLRESFSVHAVIDHLPGYLTRNVTPPPKPRQSAVVLPGNPDRFDEYRKAGEEYRQMVAERSAREAAEFAAKQRNGGHA
jgi:hypothetical protein